MHYHTNRRTHNSSGTEAGWNAALYARKIDFASPVPSACKEKNWMSILFSYGKRGYINSSFFADLSVQESEINAKNGACVTGWASPMRTSMAMYCKISATVRLQHYASIRCKPFKVAASASPATAPSIPRRLRAR